MYTFMAFNICNQKLYISFNSVVWVDLNVMIVRNSVRGVVKHSDECVNRFCCGFSTIVSICYNIFNQYTLIRIIIMDNRQRQHVSQSQTRSKSSSISV